MYKVTLYPKTSNGYSDGIDITQYIEKNGLKKITQTVDSSDFSTEKNYNFIRLTLLNHGQHFSINSTRSFFNETRDESRVRISFINDDGGVTVPFEGVINDTGTYEDEGKKTIRFTVLSYDSMFTRVFVKNPRQPNRPVSIVEAINLFLSNEFLPSSLTKGSVSVGFDVDIDDPSWFSQRTLSEALDALLLASGSILSIRGQAISVVPRGKRRREGLPVFFGYHDKKRRSPTIFKIGKINTGKQRVFNSIRVNETTVQNRNSILVNGLKDQSSLDIPFINDTSKENYIGEKSLAPFLWEKEELEITILSKDAQSIILGDLISIDFGPDVQKTQGQKLIPLYGITKRPQMPIESGRIIPRAINWEIYEKIENTKELNCKIKLRQV